MSLFNEDDTPIPVTRPPIVAKSSRIEPEVFRGITIDTDYVPSSSLLTWVEGSNWTVEYFSQILDRNNEPQPHSPDTSPVYQQYQRIRKMELKVTSPLSFSADDVTHRMDVRGSGITYPFLAPNVGDTFLGDIGDGRVGIFTITQTTRATILRDSVYNVEFIMQTELTKDLLADLERKTVTDYYFSRDSLIRGCGPFVTQPQHARHERYSRLRRELIERYMVDFHSRQHSTLLVPDQLRVTYDHFLTRAVLQLVGINDHQLVRRVRELNISAEAVMQQPTVWDALVRREPARLLGATQRICAASTQRFQGRPTLQAIHVTGIRRIVFPLDSPTDIDAYYNGKAYRDITGIALDEGRPRRHDPENAGTKAERNPLWLQPTSIGSTDDPWRMPPDIHAVTKDDYYVFSQAFYINDTQAMSKLELLARQAVMSQALNLNQLDALLEHVWEWDNLERFYYYPVVWILLLLGARS